MQRAAPRREAATPRCWSARSRGGTAPSRGRPAASRRPGTPRARQRDAERSRRAATAPPGTARPRPPRGGGASAAAAAPPAPGRRRGRCRERRRTRGEHLRDEERVAAREPVEVARRRPCDRGEACDAAAESNGRLNRVTRRSRRQLSEQRPAADACGTARRRGRSRHQRRQPAQPTRQDAQQVERGLVGPVQVLEDEHGRSGHHLRQGVDQVAGLAPCSTRRVSSPPSSAARSSSGPCARGVRSGSEPPTTTRSGAPRGELMDQRRLAGSGLAPDEHERALALFDDLGEPSATARRAVRTARSARRAALRSSAQGATDGLPRRPRLCQAGAVIMPCARRVIARRGTDVGTGER